jgi:hypothetical protein
MMKGLEEALGIELPKGRDLAKRKVWSALHPDQQLV